MKQELAVPPTKLDGQLVLTSNLGLDRLEIKSDILLGRFKWSCMSYKARFLQFLNYGPPFTRVYSWKGELLLTHLLSLQTLIQKHQIFRLVAEQIRDLLIYLGK